MNKLVNIIAGLIFFTGVIWFLQGINILPGSFMTGQIRWAIAGVVAGVVGIGLYIRNNRRPEDNSDAGSSAPRKEQH